MRDTIRGPVLRVIDGDTFDMEVTHFGRNNKYEYNNAERIRIANIHKPPLRTPAGMRSKINLERRLMGRIVRCYIQTRDTYRRLVAKIKIVK